MLAGFGGLGFNEVDSLETDLAAIVARHAQELPQVVQFTFHIGVDQRSVALTTAPEHVVFTAQLHGGFQCRFHLGAAVAHHRKVGVGRRSVHVAGMREEVGRAPEQLYAGGLLVLFGSLHNFLQVLFRFGHAVAFRGNIAVVEAVEGRRDLSKEFEGSVEASAGSIHGIAVIVPGKHPSARPKGIASGIGEGVPVGNREAQVLLHGFVAYLPIFVVIAKS